MDTKPISNCCPKCHTPLPPDAPQGLCPKCLFAAVATPTEAGQPAGHRATPPPLEEIAAAFPQLEILEFIGQGGMGFVFKARQPKLDRLVALKILPQSLAADPTFAERFNREARLLARLSHPGIVTVHDFGVAAGILPAVEPGILPGGKGVSGIERLGSSEASTHSSPHPGGKMPPSTSGKMPDATPQTADPKPQTQFYFLLMEFVDGVNLRQAMQAGRFTPEQALAIVPKICEALQFAHNEGILHRDIKPENILLDAKGRVKLADFGIAKLMERGSATRSTSDAPDASSLGVPPLGGPLPANSDRLKPELQTTLTEAGKALGTPNYMAPEQLANAGEVDHRADIYSLGVVFYEMLTGELPRGRFAPPSQKSAADPRVDEVVLRALEKEKTKRYASADEVRTQVETLVTGGRGREKAQTESGKQVALSASKGRFGRRMLVGVCNGKRVINWTGVLQVWAVFYGAAFVALYLPFGRWIPLQHLLASLVGGVTLVTGALVKLELKKSIEELTPLDVTKKAPRLTLRVVAGAACVVLAIMAIITILPERKDTTSNEILAAQPSKLAKLPTDRVIEVALSKPNSAWAWQELTKRAKSGRLDPDDARTILDSLAAWMRREHPEGYNQPLHWIGGLLTEFQPWIEPFGETNAYAFLEAFYGNPSFWPVPRIRENEITLSLTCEWRSSWLGRHSLGFKLLNEMRSISVDGRQVPVTYHSSGKWNDSYYYGRLQLPKLAPGKHVVRCEVDSAFVTASDMAGLAQDASSKDWPPAKRRWTRVCETEFMVYSPDAEIVRLSDDPALNPVAEGALSCRQIIIRSEGGHLTATAPFDVHSKVGLPISVDVALRLAGQTFQCGKLFAVKTTKVPMGTLGSGGDQELTVEIGPLDAQIKEAEIVLTPNPRAVEEYPYVDRIWGKEIVISHVPLSRQDLYGARPAAASATKPATNPGTNWPGHDYYMLYAYDVSYNLTTNVASLESRWQLLQSAISKLRDEGLKEFPDDAPIHRELAWLFQHRLGLRKVGGETSLASVSGFRRSGPVEADPDQIYFRYQWLKLVEQAQADGQLQARLKLDPTLMKSVDAQYGPLDWRLPESHAIYWVYRRLNSKLPLQGDDLTTLERVSYQSLQLSYQHGKLIGEPSPTEMRLERNLDLVPKVDAAYIQQISSFVSEQAHIRIGHRNFLLDAIVALHEAGRKTEASNLYDRLSKLYPDKPIVSDDPNSLPARLTCEEFVRRKLNEN